MRVFKASGILYKAGHKIGLSAHGIDTDSLDDIVAASPKKIPVLKGYSLNPDPENIIGYATLRRVNDGIRADIVFNEYTRRLYETILQTDQGPKENRLGFMISYKGKLNPNITKGVIRCVTMAADNLGGEIDKFGWEEENG